MPRRTGRSSRRGRTSASSGRLPIAMSVDGPTRIASMRARFGAGLTGLVLVFQTLGAAPVTAAATDFPVGFTGYHTYAEMVADVAATAAAHPDIVQRISIGKSYQGRTIWAVKISHNVT